jgi:hypothetical protein
MIAGILALFIKPEDVLSEKESVEQLPPVPDNLPPSYPYQDVEEPWHVQPNIMQMTECCTAVSPRSHRRWVTISGVIRGHCPVCGPSDLMVRSLVPENTVQCLKCGRFI